MQVPERIPRAWRREELERLVQAARLQTGEICGLPAADWWLDLLAIIWDSGMRCSELLAIRWEWLDLESGWIVVPAEVRKGRKKDEAYCLMPDCLERLRRRAQRRGLILQWNMHYTRMYQLWRKLLATAKLPANRYTLTQCMRRSFASYLTAGGGNATEALGHGSAAVTRRAYLDRTITAQPHGQKMPFRLIGGNEYRILAACKHPIEPRRYFRRAAITARSFVARFAVRRGRRNTPSGFRSAGGSS